MNTCRLTHLKELEAESIYVLREVAAQFERPALLFSGGKDSIVLSHLARKAFWPARIPFSLLHNDTGHNFEETIAYRDSWVEKIGARLMVRYVQDSIDKGRAVEEKGVNASRNVLQTVTLLDAVEELKLDAAIGGGRRDEEKARAKERFFSHRDEFGQWDPKNQRPELWNLFNGRKRIGEHFRVFPISNWTEMDVWQYLYMEGIEMPSLYFTQSTADLLPTSRPTLNALAQELRERPALRLEIAGHTDNVGEADRNLRLSQQRAQVVRRYLLQQGIDSLRLTARGYGGTRPVADNRNPQERPRNRRVEVVVQ